jgi:hypothetical protein
MVRFGDFLIRIKYYLSKNLIFEKVFTMFDEATTTQENRIKNGMPCGIFAATTQ